MLSWIVAIAALVGLDGTRDCYCFVAALNLKTVGFAVAYFAAAAG